MTEQSPSFSRAIASAQRYDGRVAALLHEGERVGYLFAYVDHLAKRRPLRRRRADDRRCPMLAWDYEFTSERFRSAGYGDHYGAAYSATEIEEVLESWDDTNDYVLGERFELEWLDAATGASIRARFREGPQDPPQSL